MRAIHFIPLLLLSTTTVGCVKGVTRSATSDFAHPQYAYELRTRDARLMPDDWTLENYVERDGELREKTHDAYRAKIEVDVDDDGEIDWRGKIPRYDFRFRHERTGAKIVIQTFPLDGHHRRTEARILLRNYIESVSGSDSASYRVDHEQVVSTERSYAPRVISQGSVTVGGRSAWQVTYDLINLEQHHVDPSAVWRRSKAILLQSGMPFLAPGAPVHITSRLPTAMLITASALPSDFDETERALEGLIARLAFYDAEHPEVRDAILRCTRGEMVGFVAGSQMGRQKLFAPGVDEETVECIRADLPDLPARSYSFARPIAQDRVAAEPTASAPEAPVDHAPVRATADDLAQEAPEAEAQAAEEPSETALPAPQTDGE